MCIFPASASARRLLQRSTVLLLCSAARRAAPVLLLILATVPFLRAEATTGVSEAAALPGSSAVADAPLTAADPFNPDTAGSWTNDRQPPPERDQLGRFLYLDSVHTRPYLSLFALGGRPCGYLYVAAADDLPRAGSAIILSADTGKEWAVVQTQAGGGGGSDGSGVGGGAGGEEGDGNGAEDRVYAYVCVEGGAPRRLDPGPGEWTYAARAHAAYGAPTRTDTGVLAPPRFFSQELSPGAPSAEDGQAAAPCTDRADWRSLGGALRCADYVFQPTTAPDGSGGSSVGGANKQNSFCGDLGYIDPTLSTGGGGGASLQGLPRNATALRWGVSAYEACPSACGRCARCAPPAAPAALGALGAEIVANWSRAAPEGCGALASPSGPLPECAPVVGVPSLEEGQRLTDPVSVQRLQAAAAWPLPPALAPFAARAEFVKLLELLSYTCAAAHDWPAPAEPAAPIFKELVEGSTGVEAEGALALRLVAPTQMSVVRYTLDGSTPGIAHGARLPSGGVVTLRRSARVRAVAVLLSEARVTARVSRVVELPWVAIRLLPPTVALASAGHMAAGHTAGRTVCARGGGDHFISISATFGGGGTSDPSAEESEALSSSRELPPRRVLRASGCPQHAWGAADDAASVARRQAWVAPLPLSPVLQQTPLSILTGETDSDSNAGVVGFAVNGVPFFAPPGEAAASGAAFAAERARRDACGGLALSINEVGEGAGGAGGVAAVVTTRAHGLYHYRAAPACWSPPLAPDGHAGLLGWMLDGVPLFGAADAGGAPPVDLDECGGHVDAGRPFYHYHARGAWPWLPPCLRGCVDANEVAPVNPALAAAAARARCRPATAQSDYAPLEPLATSALEPFVGAPPAHGGAAAGSVSVDVVCPGVPAAVGGDDGGTGAATDLGAVSAATLRFTLDGSDPAPGERAGQHTAHGAAHVVLGRSAEVRGLCEASGVLPSRVAAGPRALVAEAPHSPTWGGTVGLWNLSAPAAFRGAYARARRAVQGGCIEVHPILVDPFSAPSLAAPPEGLGDLVVVVPPCTSDAAFPGWDAEQQPSLAAAVETRGGLQGVALGGAALPLGLRLEDTVGTLAAARRLPLGALTVEMWVFLDAPAAGAPTVTGGLLGAGARPPRTFGRGIFLSYEMTAPAGATLGEAGTAALLFEVATAGADREGRGGMASVRAEGIPLGVLAGRWAHVVATYNGSHAALLLDGLPAAPPVRACPGAGACGDIAWPARASGDAGLGSGGEGAVGGSDWEGAAPVTVGAVQLHSRERGGARRMRGALALLRVLRAALSPEQAAAAAVRRVLGFDAAPCAPGSAGAYEGRPPCTPCAPGSAAVLAGQEACVPCTAGFFAAAPGSKRCEQCPGGALTPQRGATDAAECTGPDWCATALHSCSYAAECAPAPGGSFSCTCRPGYVGDGTRCDFMCGDGVRVEGEACDDGDVFPSDGCSAACEVEPGFVCAPVAAGGNSSGGGGGVATGPRDACTCTLPAGECCARAYRRCLAEHGGECEACIETFATCLRRLPPPPEGTAGDAAGGSDASGTAAAAAQCSAPLARECAVDLATCERAAAAAGGGEGSCSGGGEGDSTTASPSVSGAAGMGGSCVTRYSACLRLKACAPKVNTTAPN